MLIFSNKARKVLKKLDHPLRERIVKKIEWYAAQNNPLAFARPLSGTQGLFRYRIGEYRAVIHPDGTILTVVKIDKRDKVYK